MGPWPAGLNTGEHTEIQYGHFMLVGLVGKVRVM